MAEILSNIGVIGAGAMGRGITQAAAQAGARVTLSDINQNAAEAAKAAIAASLDRAVRKERLTSEAASRTLARIQPGVSAQHHVHAQLVIEAASEALDVKAKVFAELAKAAPQALLASNTSSLSIRAISEAADASVIGLHFFNPAHVMPLVEVILPPNAEVHRARIEATLRHWGKAPVTAPDTPGFIVNRVARPYYGEALALLEEGVAPAIVDAALGSAGYRMGPFALIDLVGADVHLAATESVFHAMGQHPRYRVFDVLRAQVGAGRLGRKSGAGFVTPAPDHAPPPETRYRDEIVRRVETTLVNEACFLLDAGGVSRDEVDTAMKLGLNFPHGPFEILSAVGASEVLALLRHYERQAPEHLTARYLPAPALLAMETA